MSAFAGAGTNGLFAEDAIKLAVITNDLDWVKELVQDSRCQRKEMALRNQVNILNKSVEFLATDIVKFLLSKESKLFTRLDKNCISAPIGSPAQHFQYALQHLLDHSVSLPGVEQELEKCKTEVAQLLLASGAEVNLKSLNGSLLHSAVRKNQSRVVEFLLQHGADVNIRDNGGQTALHVAVQGASKIIIEALIQGGGNVHARDDSGETPLALVVNNSRWDVLDSFRNLNEKQLAQAINFESLSKIHDIIASLSARGFSLSVFPGDNQNTLFNALHDGNIKQLRTLLKNPDCIELVRETSERVSPLHVAAFYKQRNKVKLLIECGANLVAEDGQGQTPVDYIMKLNHSAMFSTFLDVDSSLINNYLLSAVRYQRINIVQSLFDQGADVFVKFNNGRSLLHTAILLNNVKLVALLLENGADANENTTENGVFLHWSHNARVTELLLQYGADVNSTSRNGETILTTGSKNGRGAVVRHLVRLRAANLHISERNLAFWNNRWCDAEYVTKCEEEIARLKKEVISEFSFTLYDILTVSKNRMAKIARNETFFKALVKRAQDAHLSGILNVYDAMVISKLRGGRIRSELLEKSLQLIQTAIPMLPIECLEEILLNLDNTDLSNVSNVRVCREQ